RFNTYRTMKTGENTIPLLCRDLSLICKISVFIDDLGLDDIEDLFRIDVSALMALALLAVHEVDTSLEIGNRIHRIAVVDLVSTRVEDKQLIEHLEDVGRWLVDDGKNQLALEREFLEQVDNIFRVAR